MTDAPWRRLPIGAELAPDQGVHFRVWAPAHQRVEVVLESEPTDLVVHPEGHRGTHETPGEVARELTREPDGHFSGHVAAAGAGTRYRFRLDGDDQLFPDPASRFQPEGVHGRSVVVDPAAFVWSDAQWRGIGREGQVAYELHVGTFTPEGTFAAAERELPALADVGVTVIELMPVAEFDGEFGWGYDGVDLFAPYHHYGTPDELRRFVDRAHQLGLGVILDVVYNHLGPSGNYLSRFAPSYFTKRYVCEWGDAINFDGEESAGVREFYLANAGYWIDEYHLDGLRLDATQQIFDSSPEHILASVGRRVRAAARGRATFIVAENEPQQTQLVRPIDQNGYGLDALWNDDFHHSARVAVTGHNEAYYTDYNGAPQELVSAVKWGYLYQGQRYAWQKKRRGSPGLDLPPAAFVNFIQNHDQVANVSNGARLHQLTSPGRYRAATLLLLLAPQTPMLFQGQEFAASSPFLYFADHEPQLSRLVRAGREDFVAQFPSMAALAAEVDLPEPGARATFRRCKLDPSERERHAATVALHRDALRLRRSEPALRSQRVRGLDGAVLGPSAFVLRFFAPDGDPEGDRLLIVNFGRDVRLEPAPEPLLGPPVGCRWRVVMCTEEARYGGFGCAGYETVLGWRIPGEAAAVLAPLARRDGDA